jgi:hypothetical protein
MKLHDIKAMVGSITGLTVLEYNDSLVVTVCVFQWLAQYLSADPFNIKENKAD